MMKKILFTAILSACTAWMAAQSTPPTSASPDTSSPTTGQAGTGQSTAGAGQSDDANSGTTTTLRGCLTSSGVGYTLTDASGTTYQLSGEPSKLASHVNTMVELKGKAPVASGASAASPAAGSPANAGGAQMFSVTRVKKLSSACSTSK